MAEGDKGRSSNYPLPSPLQTQRLHLNDKCYYCSSILPTAMFLLANLENSPSSRLLTPQNFHPSSHPDWLQLQGKTLSGKLQNTRCITSMQIMEDGNFWKHLINIYLNRVIYIFIALWNLQSVCTSNVSLSVSILTGSSVILRLSDEKTAAQRWRDMPKVTKGMCKKEWISA